MAMNKTAETARERLKTLEAEMKRLLVIRDGLAASLAECETGYTRNLVSLRLIDVSRRLVRAQRESFSIETAFFFELQKHLRDEKYPPIPAIQKSVIRYADE